jgi:hypothetical protein
MIYKTDKRFVNYFFDNFMNEDGLCGLCGNTGIVETTPYNPRKTKRYHFKTFCICPNGQCLRYIDLTKSK